MARNEAGHTLTYPQCWWVVPHHISLALTLVRLFHDTQVARLHKALLPLPSPRLQIPISSWWIQELDPGTGAGLPQDLSPVQNGWRTTCTPPTRSCFRNIS